MNELDCAITFLPNLHKKIWGGSAIKDYKNIRTELTGIGESWEVSAVPGSESVVADGALAGLNLGEITRRYGPELLGKRVYARYGAKFPLLVKIIDANDDLSMQVHPGDELAMRRHGASGKSEIWYVIATRPGAEIHLGLEHGLTPDTLEAAAAAGTVGDYVATYPSRPGDTFFIPAGRIHSIGAGNLLAEIQQSSDITYRIYDYDRRDADGNLRELHMDLAKDAVDYTVLADYRNRSRNVAPGNDEIVDCDYFRVNRLELDGELSIPADPEAFRVLMCLEGEASLVFACDKADVGNTRGNSRMVLRRGQTVLIPASAPSLTMTGHAILLSAQA